MRLYCRRTASRLPFTGLNTRIVQDQDQDQDQDHHRAQLEKLIAACTSQPHSVADILPIMFARVLDLHQTTFAMGEALVHLHLLWFEEKIQRPCAATASTASTSRTRFKPQRR